MKKLIVLLFLLSISPDNVSALDWHTTPDKWKEPRNFYSEFDGRYESRIRISHSQKIDEKRSEKNIKEKTFSPNRAYWFTVHASDTMKPGLWSTDIEIFNERSYLIKIELSDYAATYATTARWINDKLLYVEFWWGRVLGTYFIYDVENESMIIKEMVHDGGTAYQQWQQNREK